MKIHDWLEIEPHVSRSGESGFRVTVWNGPRTQQTSVVVNGKEDIIRLHMAIGAPSASLASEVLRKQIRERLATVTGPIFGDQKPWPKWDAIADECIRQMEWARRAVIADWNEEEGDIAVTVSGYVEHHPLTMAADDWQVS